jgi:hypothetical protein
VEFGAIQEAARVHEIVHDGAPSVEIDDPVEGPFSRIDDIETLVFENVDGAEDVGVDELCSVGEAHLGGQLGRRVHLVGGVVQAGDTDGRVKAGDVEGVESAPALEVQQPALERTQLVDLEWEQLRLTGFEARHGSKGMGP